METTALGMIETIGLVSSLEAADAGLKAANVRLLGTDYVRGGLVMVRFEGDVAAVQAAVDAGVAAAQRVGRVFSAHVIPRAMPEVFCMLACDPSVGPGRRYGGGCAACGGCEGGRREAAEHEAEHTTGPVTEHAPEAGSTAPEKQPSPKPGGTAAGRADISYEALSKRKVVEIRQYVRKLAGFPLSPNEIRYANKAMLLDSLKRYLGR